MIKLICAALMQRRLIRGLQVIKTDQRRQACALQRDMESNIIAKFILHISLCSTDWLATHAYHWKYDKQAGRCLRISCAHTGGEGGGVSAVYLLKTLEKTLVLCESGAGGASAACAGAPSPVSPSTHDRGYDSRFSIWGQTNVLKP